MSLRLALLNTDRLPDGGALRIEVRERGLDIGRNLGVGWTLADPTRRVSGKHCEIRFAEGGYWLRDVSTNGTFINGSNTRVEGVRLLHDGDRLAIGPYLVGVEVQAAADATVVDLQARELASGGFVLPQKPPRPDASASRGPTRKLAAILSLDVVGFTRLAGADEDRTLARLRALRSDLIEPAIEVYEGRLFKRTGDGALAEFRSAVSAVRCGMEVQNGMIERNAGVAEDRRIQLRIGVHIGDVVEESDGDLMGDGVNIAARLEGVARPGSICLSEDAYRQVRGRVDCVFNDLGPTPLKNVAEPVHAYAIDMAPPARDGDKTVAPTPVGPSKRASASGRRLALIGGAVATAVILAGAGGWILTSRAPQAPRAAEALKAADAAFDQWNYAEALQRYRKLAEAGSAPAEARLGQMYQGGLGVARDYGEAANWYRKAAAQGDAGAEAALGSFYRDGRGVPRDPAEALRWYTLAADSGFVPAQMLIAFMYARGQSVPKDCAAARGWFERAASQGADAARAWLASNDECPMAK